MTWSDGLCNTILILLGSERCRFLSISSNEHQNILPVNHHKQKCLIKGICGSFDIKSNYFGPVIPKKRKKFEELDMEVIKCKHVFPKIDQK